MNRIAASDEQLNALDVIAGTAALLLVIDLEQGIPYGIKALINQHASMLIEAQKELKSCFTLD